MHARAARGQSPLLVYHNGPVMTTTVTVHPIFWRKLVDLDIGRRQDDGPRQFLMPMGNSDYLTSNTEYTQNGASGPHVTTSVTSVAATVDLAVAPKSGSQTSPILAEVCKVITNPSPNAYYPVRGTLSAATRASARGTAGAPAAA